MDKLTLEPVERLKNSDFILENKMAELNQNNHINPMLCENFISTWK